MAARVGESEACILMMALNRRKSLLEAKEARRALYAPAAVNYVETPLADVLQVLIAGHWQQAGYKLRVKDKKATATARPRLPRGR